MAIKDAKGVLPSATPPAPGSSSALSDLQNL